MVDLNAAEKANLRHSSELSSHEKAGVITEETAHEAAVRGAVATDQ